MAAYGEHVVNLVDLEVGMRLGELLNAGREDMDEVNRLISVMKRLAQLRKRETTDY